MRTSPIWYALPVPILGRDLARAGGRWAELEEFVPHLQPDPSQESYLRLFDELGRCHAGLRATWEPDLPQPLDDHRTHRQLQYWLGFTRRGLGAGAEPVLRRAKLLLDELGQARRGVDLPRAPIHGDYKLGKAVRLSDGSWLNLDLDFVRIRERLYDVAASLYWASESGSNVDLRELCDACDSSAPEPVTPDERRLLPAQITLIPLHWVATAGFIGGVPEAERAMDARLGVMARSSSDCLLAADAEGELIGWVWGPPQSSWTALAVLSRRLDPSFWPLIGLAGLILCRRACQRTLNCPRIVCHNQVGQCLQGVCPENRGLIRRYEGDDVGGVFVEVLAAPVVHSRGPGIGVPGGDLDFA